MSTKGFVIIINNLTQAYSDLISIRLTVSILMLASH